MPVLAYPASLAWIVSLTLVDGWEHGVLTKLAGLHRLALASRRTALGARLLTASALLSNHPLRTRW